MLCVYTHVHVMIFLMCSLILNCILTTASASIKIKLLKSINDICIIILPLHSDQR